MCSVGYVCAWCSTSALVDGLQQPRAQLPLGHHLSEPPPGPTLASAWGRRLLSRPCSFPLSTVATGSPLPPRLHSKLTASQLYGLGQVTSLLCLGFPKPASEDHNTSLIGLW